MAERKIRDFFINSGSNSRLYESKEIIDAVIEENPTSDNNSVNDSNENNIDVSNENTLKQRDIIEEINSFNEAARTNPFLYNYNLKQHRNLESVEDFYVKNGKREVLFATLVRTNGYRKGKRKRILKKNFKRWNFEVNQKLNDLKNYATVQYNVNESMKFQKLSIGIIIFNILSLILSVIMLNNSLEKIIVFDGVLKDLTYYSVLALLASLFGSVFLRIVIRNSKMVFRNNKKKYHKEIRKIENDYKDKFKYTYKYYISGMKRDAFKFKKKTLKIEESSIREDRIKMIEEIVANGNKQIVSFNKNSKKLKFVKFMVAILCVIPSVYVFGIFIYKLIIGLIK